MKHDNLYAETTARIVAALEKGVAPRVRPWSTGVDTLPMNAQTGRAHRGVNVLLLSMERQRQGYALDRWLTFRQAAELGGHVRRGESGIAVVLWKLRKVNLTVDSYPDRNEPNLHERVIPLLRAFTVFNVAQVDGLPDAIMATMRPVWEPEAEAEKLLLMSGAIIHHGGSKAFYEPGTDSIHLPPRHAFSSATGYYNTALPEAVHWTGHPSRCNRDLSGRFRSHAYAVEELIAEMGCAFLSAHCRIDGELRHAAYLSSWLQVLRTDARAVFVVSTRAQQASDYLLKLTQPAEVIALAA
jgi:antirestriction protein ArdC